jgi:hypothetical protein
VLDAALTDLHGMMRAKRAQVHALEEDLEAVNPEVFAAIQVGPCASAACGRAAAPRRAAPRRAAPRRAACEPRGACPGPPPAPLPPPPPALTPAPLPGVPPTPRSRAAPSWR